MQRAQAGEFYRSLPERERENLAEAIAEDIFFMEDEVCQRLMCALHEVDEELEERIRKINGFTTR